MIAVITREAENKAVEKMSKIKSESSTWRAIILNFSQLLEIYRSEYQKNIVVNVMMDHLKDSDGGIFVCNDGDIIIIVSGVMKTQLERMVFQLRYLFSDDPLAYNIEGEENPEFAGVHDLGVNWAAFHDICRRKVASQNKKDSLSGSVESGVMGDHVSRASNQQGSNQAVTKPSQPTKKQKVLTPNRLYEIERDLTGVDLSRVLRKQPICAVSAKMELRKIFDEFYINIAHLQRLVMAEVNLYSNAWLFKYLTQVLDTKMLAMIAKRPAYYLDNAVSLNLNIDTLMSEAFLEFDASIKPSVKVSVIIEIHVSDVFANMQGFIDAKNKMQKLGYKICLDGLTHLSFPQVDREKLGFDLAKMQWHTDMEANKEKKTVEKLSEIVKNYGNTRVILCRCDNKSAVEYGQSMGISLFQGRYLDFLLNPTSKVVN